MRRILFVKTSSLGDVVHHAPAVSDAARALPTAEIHWVVEEPFADIARMHLSVKRVFPVAMRRWRRSLWSPSVWSEIDRFRGALSEQPYDAIVDSQGLLKSALICAAANGTKHGLDRLSAREPLAARFYDVRHAVPKNLHAVERNRRLTAAALRYPYGGALDYGLRAAKASPVAGTYGVFLTMTSRADKLWPEERWMALGADLGCKVVLPWGSDAERERAESIAMKIPGSVVPQKMAIAELAGLLHKARFVVGVDTGLTHLAAALAVRTLGIYCGSDPGLTGLYGGNSSNLGTAGNPPKVAEVRKALG
jgi:heptosyltransferase-1